MKDYMKPELETVEFVTERIADDPVGTYKDTNIDSGFGVN